MVISPGRDVVPPIYRPLKGRRGPTSGNFNFNDGTLQHRPAVNSSEGQRHGSFGSAGAPELTLVRIVVSRVSSGAVRICHDEGPRSPAYLVPQA